MNSDHTPGLNSPSHHRLYTRRFADQRRRPFSSLQDSRLSYALFFTSTDPRNQQLHAISEASEWLSGRAATLPLESRRVSGIYIVCFESGEALSVRMRNFIVRFESDLLHIFLSTMLLK
jgi:hypothetical protein